MTLKEQMERIWREWPCHKPLHLVRWVKYPVRKGLWFWLDELFYLVGIKGTPSPPIPRKNLWERFK